MDKPTINTTEAARRAGVSTDTIRRWARLGYLHFVRVGPGRRFRIDPDELTTVVNRGRADEEDHHLAEVSK